MSAERARSILIVEDEAIVAADLQQSLVELGYDAFAIAASSEEAIQYVIERCPDIILMDIRLDSDRDGIDTATALRASHDVPIIYLTAHADDATIARAKLTRPYGYLVKPVNTSELRSAIELSLHRHDAERSERQMQRQLELADRLHALSTLTAGLAHEINTPLAVVIANSDFIRGELEELEQASRAGKVPASELTARLAELRQIQTEISTAGSRIARLVADLGDVVEQSQSGPVGDADVGRAIRWAMRAVEHELQNRARLVHDIPDLPAVPGDEARLGQVFLNLLRNAARAIAPDQLAEHEVAIRARTEGRRVVIEVRDDGCGIAPEHLPRIFDPFFTTRTVGEGRGLGLAVCRGIVTSLGGAIEVESQPGCGAVFRVLLPVVPSAAITGPSSATAPEHSRARILLIDDDAMMHRMMKRLLRDHDLTCANSAAEALALLASDASFDVILSDVMMPTMSGVEFYEELRRRQPELVCRLVFVTGGARATPGAEEFLRSLPNVTLEKPFGQPELLSAVTLALARR